MEDNINLKFKKARDISIDDVIIVDNYINSYSVATDSNDNNDSSSSSFTSSRLPSDLRRIRLYYSDFLEVTEIGGEIRVIANIQKMFYINEETAKNVLLDYNYRQSTTFSSSSSSPSSSTSKRDPVHLWFPKDKEIMVKMRIEDILTKL